jgi:hypothetical protein
MITNQHAATLRGMATQLVADQLIQNKRWTKAGLSVLNEGYLSAQAKYERGVAALLAGAEALEAVEVAKAALAELKKEYEGAGMADEKRKATYKWSLTRINAALARLEGNHG